MISKLKSRDWFWAIWFLLPSVLGSIIFMFYPMVKSLYYSFTDFALLGNTNIVGFDNFVRAFSDPTALKVFRNTLVFTIASVPALLIIPLFLAMALNQKIRGVRFFRAAYFLPTISSMVAMSMVWQWMFNRDFGLVNYILGWFGISGPNWLSSSTYSLVAIIIVSVWKSVGYNMMLFLSGLQSIPSVYYEAADVDGCVGFRRLLKITLPLLRPTALFVTVMTIINSLQVFDQVMVITGGGPSRSSSVLVHYIYQSAFRFDEMGYGSALAWVLTIFIFGITFVQFIINRSDYSLE